MKHILSIAVVAVLVIVGAIAWRKAEVNRATAVAELQRQIAEKDSVIAELRQRLEENNPAQIAAVNPRIPGDPQAALAMEAELQRRLAEVSTLKSNTTELLTALAAGRELPEAPETPEHVERRRIELSVLQKQLDEARKSSAAIYNQTKELLITMNIPPEIASLRNDKALASVELQHYWPFFEARKESEIQQTLVERLKMRVLMETIEAEAADIQRKMAAQKPKTLP